MPGLDIAELEPRMEEFQKRIDRLKSNYPDIVWYPYGTLASISVFDRLLTGSHRALLDLAGGDPILDLGCSDGLMAFFFESLGCEVLALDNPHVNHNQSRGFHALHSALNSKVKFEAVDLDSQFHLPREIFGLTLFLGVLYHLKNPYYTMEALAPRTRYCLMSTRIAQRTPKGNPMKAESLAYLLGDAESNNDSTNYWIFSETALRTLLERTGWKVCDFSIIGATSNSEPARLDRDERAFYLLESKRCPKYSVQLMEGWHELEQVAYRWTERRFSIEIRRPHLISFATMQFAFRVEGLAPVTLQARVNGVDQPPAKFPENGEHSYEISISAQTLKAPVVRVDFELDKSLAAESADGRELGLLVPFWNESGYDPLLPFQLS
jgi:tRNA (mo5U34)-methyltransferase